MSTGMNDKLDRVGVEVSVNTHANGGENDQVGRGHANVQIRHVRSHTGENGNEVADILAKEGAQATYDDETARNRTYIESVERRPPAHDEPQHRKTTRRK